jgi:hypothetical protein
VKYGPEQRVQIIWKIIENGNGYVIASGGTVVVILTGLKISLNEILLPCN